MLALKLAYRNLIGAGLRTWLNVFVLSFSYVIIIWHSGILDGWDLQAKRDMINWEFGGGQYWHSEYDPYDPFTLNDSHDKLHETLQNDVNNKKATPILISQATIYPDGRMQTILIKGIDADQKIIEIPSEKFRTHTNMESIPAVIGTRMAKNSMLNRGDLVMLRWRDVNGTFDAVEVKIIDIFKTNVPTVDAGQIWIPLDKLQSMLQVQDEATLVVTDKETEILADNTGGWQKKDLPFLLKDFNELMKSKSIGGSIMWIILLMLALLAIFDTQVLSIFRRQREIGTEIALGMTRFQVVTLFTVEGSMHAVLAAIVGAAFGIPFLVWQAKTGWKMPPGTDDYGITIADTIYPVFSLGLIMGTVALVVISATIVSFIPAKKISKMNPTDAIKGKIQ